MTDTRLAVDRYLDEIGVTFTITGGTLGTRDNWLCFAWTVHITRGDKSVTFEYYTGSAHAVRTPRGTHPVKPDAADVLCCLLQEAEANNQSFNEWCSQNYFDSDSIKGFNTYRACCEVDEKLRQVFKPVEVIYLSHKVVEL